MVWLDVAVVLAFLLNISAADGMYRVVWVGSLVLLVATSIGATFRWRLAVGPDGIEQVRWRTRRWAWSEVAGIWTGPAAHQTVVAPVGERPRRIWLFERVRDAADAGLVETVTSFAQAEGVPVAPLPFHLPPIWPLDAARLSHLPR